VKAAERDKTAKRKAKARAALPDEVKAAERDKTAKKNAKARAALPDAEKAAYNRQMKERMGKLRERRNNELRNMMSSMQNLPLERPKTIKIFHRRDLTNFTEVVMCV
jgi:transcription elongation GreA/GreB family factor